MVEGKKKTGRPLRVLTDKEINQVESLASVLSIEQLSDYLGIVQSTFQEILKRQGGVFSAYKKGKSKAIGTVAKSLVQKAMDGDTASAIFYLKTQARWSEPKITIAAEHSGTVNFSELSEEAINARIEELSKKS